MNNGIPIAQMQPALPSQVIVKPDPQYVNWSRYFRRRKQEHKAKAHVKAKQSTGKTRIACRMCPKRFNTTVDSRAFNTQLCPQCLKQQGG